MEEQQIAENTRVIIVSIEDYYYTDISKVKYATKDAQAFYNLMINHFKIPSENIKLYINNNATKSVLEDNIVYEIKQLAENERFIFYYVGHGFYENNTNKITAWDTNPNNFGDTTISLKDKLILPLENSKCKQSLIFLDTCSQYLSSFFNSRDIISDIKDIEFETLFKSGNYCGIYFSCTPGEKSYSNDTIEHGIWTYYLLKALKGEDERAILREKYVTDTSLRDYLRKSIPEFITNNTEIRQSQTPYAKIASNSSFLIHKVEIKKPEIKTVSEYIKIKIVPNSMLIRTIKNIEVSKAKGFKFGYLVPNRVNEIGKNAVFRAFETDISDNLQLVYQNTKDVFGLKRKEITKIISKGEGKLSTELFDYLFKVAQNEESPSFGQVTIALTIKTNKGNIPSNFDTIFPDKLNWISFNIENIEDDFENLVEMFENFAEKENSKILDDDRKMQIHMTTIDGLIMIINLKKKGLAFSTNREYTLLKFVENAELLINQFVENPIKIIND